MTKNSKEPSSNSFSSLTVFWGGQTVGLLEYNSTGSLQFRYDPKWIAHGNCALSISMPLTVDPIIEPAHNFFANILPEGDFRRKIEKIFKVSADNDFSLLAAIGGDCAGAISIGRPTDMSEDSFYEPLSPDALDKLIATEGLSAFNHSGSTRLALAGAQGKLPVYVIDDTIQLPHGGAPSTHIIKFNRSNHVYPRLIENELFITQIAAGLGMNVIKAELKIVKKKILFISQRYDRRLDNTGWPQRLHQEDFCQALGISHQRKYQKEGGPSFTDCAALVRKYLTIKDLNDLIDWFFFNLIIGNSDAHGKNLSLVYDDSGNPRLAPFYDLVCTRAYQSLDRMLAMAVVDEYDPNLISPKHLSALAEAISVTTPFLRSRLKEILAKLPAATVAAQQTLTKIGVSPAQMQHIYQTVTKLIAATNKRFA